MDQRFKDIKVIAWDIDATLYKPVAELSLLLKNGCIEEVAKSRKLSFNDAKMLYEKEREKWGSTFMAFMSFGWHGLEAVKKMEEIERKINKFSYIKRDRKLSQMFLRLSSFRHFILRNGTRATTEKLLDRLGVNPEIFEGMITTEDSLLPKPNPAPFNLLFKITGLPPEQHLYVGDREKVDIEPAKKLGMKTILVWEESKMADASVPTVYDVVGLLI